MSITPANGNMTENLLNWLHEEIARNEKLVEEINSGGRIVERKPGHSGQFDRTDEMLLWTKITIERLKVETDAVEAAKSPDSDKSDMIWRSLKSVVDT